MIRGRINRNRKAIIELDVVGSNLHEKSVKQALSIQPNYLQASELLSETNHPRNWLKLGVANVLHFTRRILRLSQD